MGLNGCDGTWRAAVKVAKFVAGWSHRTLYTFTCLCESFKIFTDEIWTLNLIENIFDWLFLWIVIVHVFDGVRCGFWANNGSTFNWEYFRTHIHTFTLPMRNRLFFAVERNLRVLDVFNRNRDCMLRRSFKGQDCLIRFSGSYIHSVIYYFIRFLRDFLFVFSNRMLDGTNTVKTNRHP